MNGLRTGCALDSVRNQSLVGVFCCLFLSTLLTGGAEPVTRLAKDERLLLFPGVCYPTGNRGQWTIKLQGCVYEPSDAVRSLAFLEKLLSSYGVRLTESDRKIFRERARLFMADNESGRRVYVRCGGTVQEIGKTQSNGRFSGELKISNATASALGLPGTNRVLIQAILAPGREPVTAEVAAIPASGWIVISDIDDTIKLSMVRHPQALLRNTFLEPFQAIPGMSALYTTWAKETKANFYYLSGSPWQLYEPLAQFIRDQNFPQGNFSLKQFRLKDGSLKSLWADQREYKIEGIEALLRQFERQRFALVGDSGEMDPEAFGELARKYPDRIAKVFIRNVTAETQSADRYKRAFADVPESKWKIFRDPTLLFGALQETPAQPER